MRLEAKRLCNAMTRRLPAVSDSQGVLWELPLAEGTACDLLAALVSQDPHLAHLQLTEALSQDPSLVLWSLSWAQPAEPCGLPQLALRLLDDGLERHLQWPDATGDAGGMNRFTAPRLTWQRWAHAAAAACETAWRVQPLAACRSQDECDAATMLGVISDASIWLAAGNSAGRRDAIYPLPTWLKQWLNELWSHSTMVAPTVAWVRQAISELPTQRSGPIDDALASQLAAVRHRWLRPASPVADVLPDFMRARAASQRREAEFAARLEAEKLAAMKELASGAGHEINNPLANIASRAQTLLSDESDPDRRKKLMTINTQAFRAHEIIADMMLFAKPPKLVRKSVDIVTLIQQVMRELAADAERQQVNLACQPTGIVPTVHVDPVQIGVAIKAICVNALEAMRSAGRIEIVPAVDLNGDDQQRHGLSITITDTGPGIDAATRSHIFDPFYSGREAGRGAGMGLSKAWRIVREHGGVLEVSQPVGGGASFTMRIPLVVESWASG